MSLIILSIMMLSFAIAYQSKQIKKAEAILQRLEEKEKKQKLLKEKED